MNQDKSYTLLLKALLKKGYQNIDISAFSESQKQGIEEAAEELFNRGFILEAIQAFHMLRNIAKLNKIGEGCINNNKNELAFEAFKLSNNKDGLIKAGNAFLKNSEIQKAYIAFKLADNQEMLAFIEKNFNNKP